MTTAKQTRPRPVVLCVLDGWGHREATENNAIALAETPNWDRMVNQYPRALIHTHGEHVGLPDGQMGNSEVGHMNLGAGRVVMQELPRIGRTIRDGQLGERDAVKRMVAALKDSGGTAHLMGLMSPGGVHSHQDHIAALAKVLDDAGVPVRVHAFLDGRDTPPRSAEGFIQRFEHDVKDCADVAIATVSGRFHAMDRDQRWQRVELAHDALTAATGQTAATALEAVIKAYDRDENDEFVKPTVIGDYAGMADGDGLLFANFRADRAREIMAALIVPDFDGFARKKTVSFAATAGMTEYSKDLARHMDVVFPPSSLDGLFGEVVAAAGRRQLRIAETEKYAHVTFFFNGGREQVYDGEERILVPSPKVETYDLKPEMSAFEVTDRLVEAIDGGTFDTVVLNFANGDMVGHTGDLEAAKLACAAVDACLGRLEQAVTRSGGCLLITADHGNAEQMVDPETGGVHTAHTVGDVPLVLVNPPDTVTGLDDGRLADVAPTLLALMGLDQPAAMTGRSLLKEPEHARLAQSAGR